MLHFAKRSAALVAAAAMLSLAGAAHATITVYTSLAAFNTAIAVQATDTYPGFSVTGTTPSPLVRTVGPYGYTASAANSFYFAGTAAHPWLCTDVATDPIVFNAFTGGVQAVGGNFFDTDVSGAFLAGNVTIAATDASGTVTQTITGATVTSFVGFVSDGLITTVTLTADQTGGNHWPTADNFVLAFAAPGACCSSINGACIVAPAISCSSVGLTYIPGNAACTPTSCSTLKGACCSGATCAATTAAGCGMGSTFLGVGVACAPVGRGGPINACCKADFNNSGGVSVQDIFAFLTAWFAGCP